MEHWISHICEPRQLLLAWQGPDPNGDRTRFGRATNSAPLLQYKNTTPSPIGQNDAKFSLALRAWGAF